MLNGDKPILEFREQEIWVHPSPWKGKENMGQMLSAPLGGIILLEQSTENVWRSVSINDAVMPLFFQFVFSRATIITSGSHLAAFQQGKRRFRTALSRYAE